MADPQDTTGAPVVTRAEAKAAGLKRYFTGKHCCNGHIAQRHTANGCCLACVAVGKPERDAAYRAKNWDKVYAAQKVWRKANWDRVLEANRRYLSTTDGREKNRIASERIRIRNPGRTTEWKRANPEAVKALYHNREARKRAAGGSHTREQLAVMLAAQRCKCVACKVSLKDGYHVDHIMPVARGGSNDISNIQLLCARCNCSKKAKDPIVWANLRGLLL